MKLVIIRGPSGSGKSTIAKAFGGISKRNWFEADMFFHKDGMYQFDPRLLGEAHRWCQNGVYSSLKENVDIIQRDDYWKSLHLANPKPERTRDVIVSNTSTTLAEANTYIKIAQEAGVPYEVVRTPGPWNIDELFRRNEHNVPRAVLEKQVARYVAVPGEVEWSDMTIFKKEN